MSSTKPHASAVGPARKPSFFPSAATDQAVAGFLGGAASTVALHPLDLVKTRFQADTSATRPRLSLLNTARALARITQAQGVRGLYQGLSPNFAGATLSWGLYFWWYTHIKDAMLHRHILAREAAPASEDSGAPVRLRADQHLLAAAGAGALTSLCTNPIWLVKTRMCLQSPDAPRYTSMWNALTTIARTEGITGLYRGLVPALFGVSHGAIQFMVYEDLKVRANEYRDAHGGESYLFGYTSEHIMHAVVSKTVAAVTTYPYQLVKTRLQAGTGEFSGVLDVITKTWRREGITGFYKGLGANVIRVMPGTCITFVVYESMTTFFKNHAS
ncbi:mitochondrial FAD carrier protein flx1 [Blastocladiella emersonii ATCC 22665]|nr:mitochondrial FAD carrier protein flx1 [Blastocladiella emersonii ATCC 22665]